jgi:hypothetical protein
MNATAKPARLAAYPSLVDLDIFVGFRTDAINVGADHRGPELMKYLEGSLVAGQPEFVKRQLRWPIGDNWGGRFGGRL